MDPREPSRSPSSPAPLRGRPGRIGRREGIVALSIGVAVLAIFGRAIGHGFLDYDDGLYVWENPMVKAGVTLKGVVWAFTTTYASQYWHPVTWLSHMLDVQIYGLDPRGHHLSSLLLHALNAGLLFLLLRRMTGALWRSLVVTLLFALHPLHVESAAWISERKDLLSTLFWIAATHAYVRYVEVPRRARFLPVLVLFVFGLLSKPMLVTFPFTLLLLDYWPLGRTPLWRAGPASGEGSPEPASGGAEALSLLELVKEKAPLFLLSALVSVLNAVVQPRRTIASLAELPLLERGANAVVGYGFYIWKMLWPARLAVLYPHHGMPATGAIAASAILLGSISVLVLLGARRWPYLGFGWLWYLGTLVPVIGIVQVGSQATADRYTYMPLLGLFIIIVWGLPELAARWSLGKPVVRAAGVASLGACLVLTWTQLGYWKDSITLFERTLAVTKGNWVIHYNLGCLLVKRGEIDRAVEHYVESVRINPSYAEARTNLGSALYQEGRSSEALVQFEAALRIDPNLALPHQNIGWILAARGELEGADPHYREAMRLAPSDALVRVDFGKVQIARGAFGDAIATLQEALRIDPQNTEARVQMGIALTQGGRASEATVIFREALRDAPDSPEALNGLAWILATAEDSALRDGEEAVRLAERASELTGGGDPNLLDTLAAAYAEAARFEEAAQTEERALERFRRSGQGSAIRDCEERLRLFRGGLPFRERPGATPPSGGAGGIPLEDRGHGARGSLKP